MSLKTFFVKVGKDIVAAVEYPFIHTAQLVKVLDKIVTESEEAVAEAPKAKQLIAGLVEQFEKLGPDVLADLSSKGLNFAADAQTVEDVQAAFTYLTQTFFPGVEAIYEDLADPPVQVQSGAPSAPIAAPQGKAIVEKANPSGGLSVTMVHS